MIGMRNCNMKIDDTGTQATPNNRYMNELMWKMGYIGNLFENEQTLIVQ